MQDVVENGLVFYLSKNKWKKIDYSNMQTKLVSKLTVNMDRVVLSTRFTAAFCAIGTHSLVATAFLAIGIFAHRFSA